MVYMYTAVFSKVDDDKIYARIPDIKGCMATGWDLLDAVQKITETLTGFLLVYEDDDMPIPEPTEQFNIERGDSDILSLITVDTIAYRDWIETRSV